VGWLGLLIASGFAASSLAFAQPPVLCPSAVALQWTSPGFIQRSKTGFTEGLIYQNGALFESTGNIQGRSVLNRIDSQTGKVTTLLDTPGNVFGEGLTYLDGLMFQLTYRDKKLFIYDPLGTRLIGTKTNPFSEGWGLTTDEKNLIGSDGTDQIFFVNPFTLEKIKTLKVRNGTVAVQPLNSLQYVDGKIYANVFMTRNIVRIDAQTGCVTGILDMSRLFEAFTPSERAAIRSNVESVLNGIAYNAAERIYYVTGKNWPKIFKVRISDLP
jgi:glutamine cyclotransferase